MDLFWFRFSVPSVVMALISGVPFSDNARAADQVIASPASSNEARYTAADAYLGENIDKLIENRDAAAHFVDHGKGVLYRLKDTGGGTFYYRDLQTGQTRAVATSTVMTRELKRAVPKPTVIQRPEVRRFEYDSSASLLLFAALGRHWSFSRSGVLAETTAGDYDDQAVSPDGRFKIVARDFNLFAQDVMTGREVTLTNDGTTSQPYGRGIAPLSLIMAQNNEEPVMPVSIRWSPDSRRILTWRLDIRAVQPMALTQQNPVGSLQPKNYSYIYPLAGSAALPTAQRLVIDVKSAFESNLSKIVPLQVPLEALTYPAEPDMMWLNGKPRVQWIARGYKQVVIYTADPTNGSVTVVARETVKPLVTITSTSLMPVPALGGEIAISERSGWAQLYLVRPEAPDGGIPLTRGNWEVLSINRVSGDGKSLLITGVGREHDRNPYFKALYRLALDGSQPTLLTPEPLNHEVEISPDGDWIIDRMSSPVDPTRTVLRAASDGHVVAELAHADPAALMSSGFIAPEPFKGVAADGKTPLYGMIFRPAHLNAAKRYPVIENIYTAPTQTNVPASWDDTILSTSNSVAQLGAIVVMIDGRGTSRRGQNFRLPAYQNLGEVGLDDHIAIIRQMAIRYHYMDLSRVGVFGGSAGGYDAVRFILRRPDFVKVAVASSGNHDLRLDKAWWAETSMGDADQGTWDKNSNIPIASNLRGKVLLIHGEIDDNVPVVESYRMSDAFIRAGKYAELVILPNIGHRLGQPVFWRKFRDFFNENLIDKPTSESESSERNFALNHRLTVNPARMRPPSKAVSYRQPASNSVN